MHKYDYVKNYFKENNCILLSDTYKTCKDKLDYICSCGKKSTITFDAFKRGHRCKDCGVKKSAKTRSYSYEQVKKIFENNGCVLLSEQYIKNDVLLDYICSCGKISKITLNNFLNGQRCYDCGLLKIGESKKYLYEEVKQVFLENGCELLSKEYINNSQLLEYKCSCGNISKIKFNHFIQGHRCMNCKMSRGERKIKKYLLENNIKFVQQLTFKECRNKKPLRFDFAIFDNKDNLLFLIEYNGEQHYKNVKYFEKRGSLEYTQSNDEIKINFCKDKSIDLLVIPFSQYNTIENILTQKLLDKYGGD
jgi:hypothetical protein